MPPLITFPLDIPCDQGNCLPAGDVTAKGKCDAKVRGTMVNFDTGQVQTRNGDSLTPVPAWKITFTGFLAGCCQVCVRHVSGSDTAPTCHDFCLAGHYDCSVEIKTPEPGQAVPGPTIIAKGKASGPVFGDLINWTANEIYSGDVEEQSPPKWKLSFSNVQPGRCTLIVSLIDQECTDKVNFRVTAGHQKPAKAAATRRRGAKKRRAR